MSQETNNNFFVHTLLRAKDWQHRSEFDQVCDWWRDGGHGVCALVGMGGAGKTAIAEQFLHSLPGVFPTSERKSIDFRKLPVTLRVFVYSFYDDDKPANFIESLQMWVEGKARVDDQLSITQLKYLLQGHYGLMVLDGLERIQEPCDRGFGKLVSPQVRELLDHIASGASKKLGVLLTSRFPLTDLRDSDHRFYRTIEISRIGIEAGIRLLRDRGVRGSVSQLSKIVENCGQHALTIDLAGGFISEFENGDPETDLRLYSSETLEFEIDDELDPTRRAILKQGRRFLAIADRYRQAMQERDEASLALLERVCMFSRGASRSLIQKIFTGRGKEGISGVPLASLNTQQLKQKLDWLVALKIVEQIESPCLNDASSRDITYTVHPAVRDGFLQGIADHQKSIAHDAIGRGIALTLGTRPGNKPSDKPTLDLLEEIAFHTLQNGRVDAAWNIYQNRMGGCHNLLAELNDYERTERITGSILRQHDCGVNRISDHTLVVLLSDHGYASLEIGKTLQAENVLTRGLTLSRKLRSNIETLTGNLIYVLHQRGKLKTLCETLRESLPLIQQDDQKFYYLEEYVKAEVLRGKIPAVIDPRDYSIEVDEGLAAELPLRFVCEETIRPSTAQLRQATETARRSYPLGHRSTAVAQLQLAEALILDGLFEQARAETSQATDWANAHDASGIRCQADLVSARIEFAEMNYFARESGILAVTDQALVKVSCLLESGLRIARNCGFSLCHLELMLEKAKLALLRGDPQNALQVIDIAINSGVEENTDTGQMRLFAALDEQCNYAWSIPVSLQLVAESLLLQAAQLLGTSNWKDRHKGRKKSFAADEIELRRQASVLIKKARSKLHECLDYWHSLRDPGPGSPNNLRIGDKDCCYRAAGAQEVLEQLRIGILTRHPLVLIAQTTQNVELLDDNQIPGIAGSMTLEESLEAFVLELERYDASFAASVDEFDEDEFAIGIDHSLNIAATNLGAFYPAGKLPVAPRQTFRQLINAARRHAEWESVERAIGELHAWAGAEIKQLEIATKEQKSIQGAIQSFPSQQTTQRIFDVFLAHNSSDKEAVTRLKRQIQARTHEDGRQLTAWLDKDELQPGIPRQKLIEEGIRNSISIAVLVAADGLGLWQVEEMNAALELAIRDGRPVIPVLLPGASESPNLPLFLSNRPWVDLRPGISGNEFENLIWGITGKRPTFSDTVPSPHHPSSAMASTEKCFPTIVTTLPAVYECICVRGREFFSITWDSRSCVEVNRQKVTPEYAARAMSEWKSYAPEVYEQLFPAADFNATRAEQKGQNASFGAEGSGNEGNCD